MASSLRAAARSGISHSNFASLRRVAAVSARRAAPIAHSASGAASFAASRTAAVCAQYRFLPAGNYMGHYEIAAPQSFRAFSKISNGLHATPQNNQKTDEGITTQAPLINGDFLNSIIEGFRSIKLNPQSKPTIIDRCHSLIQASNQSKPVSEPAVVVLLAAEDPDRAFADYRLLPSIEQLAKTHYVALQVIGNRREKLGETINRIAKELGGRAIKTLVIKAHGERNRIQFGRNNFYTEEDVKAEDFSCLDRNASIILESCLVGQGLARKIASVQSRPVFASAKAITDCVYTYCCKEHGYGMIGFDATKNIIVKRYQQEGASITETAPCFVTPGKIQEIQKILHDQTVKAAEQGDARAQNNLGADYTHGHVVAQSTEKAVIWFQKAAEQGHVFAQYNLGQCYEKGYGVAHPREEAIHWYRKAADQGLALAQYKVGLAYSLGLGVEESLKEAVKWYKRAAEQGHAYAQYSLGFAYEFAQGTWQSFEEAVIWYQRAADQGEADAQYSLGAAYKHGQGVHQSDKEALKWYQKAAVQGHAAAQYEVHRTKGS